MMKTRVLAEPMPAVTVTLIVQAIVRLAHALPQPRYGTQHSDAAPPQDCPACNNLASQLTNHPYGDDGDD